MSGETSRPKEGERISDIPKGKFDLVIDKLIEEGLHRKPFERIVPDWPYRQAVAAFMCRGYDEQRKAEQAACALQERRKNRRKLRRSGYDSGPTEEFCKLAIHEPGTFIRTAAWSLVQRIARRSEGHSPVRYELSTDKVERLKALLPARDEKNRSITGIGVLADALVYACRSATTYVTCPGGYYEYAKTIRHGGLGIGQTEEVRRELQELTEVDPVLFLELLSVSFCKLIIGQSKKRAEALYELIKPETGILYASFEACPEIDTGEVLNYFCTHIAQWRGLRESYPDPKDYYSIEFCCSYLCSLQERLYSRELLGLSGTLAKGFRLTVWKDLNTIKEEVWLEECPYCKKPFYTPPEARIYNEKKDQERLGIW